MRHSNRFMLWIDAVGGFWVCLGNEVTLGQPDRQASADVPILGDLSSRHARIRRVGGEYLIEAFRDVRVNGQPVRQATSLAPRSVVQLGDGVRLVFRRPHPLSATARLDFLSRHRTEPTVDAVLLMADSCVLGPRPQSHVVCRDWPAEVILYRHDRELFCHTAGAMEIDGESCRGRGRVHRNSRVVGEHFSLSLEAIV